MVHKILSVLLVAIAAVFAAAPARVAVDANYEWSLDTTISSSTAFDTIAASDSSTIRTWYPKTGYEYILVRSALTGANAAAVTCQVVLNVQDIAGNHLYQVVADSVTTAPGEAYLLPVGQSAIGAKMVCKFVTYGTSGAEVIINRLYMYKRRVMNQDKRLW